MQNAVFNRKDIFFIALFAITLLFDLSCKNDTSDSENKDLLTEFEFNNYREDILGLDSLLKSEGINTVKTKCDSLLKAIENKESKNWAKLNQIKGKLHLYQYEYSEAKDCFIIAQNFWSNNRDTLHLEFGEIQHSLSYINYCLLNYSESLKNIQRSNFIRKKLLNKKNKRLGEGLKFEGHIYEILGDLSTAKIKYHASQKHLKSHSGIESSSFAENLINLSNVSVKQGEYTTAESLLTQANEILKSDTSSIQLQASGLSGLATIKQVLGDFEESERLNLKSIELIQSLFDKDPKTFGMHLSAHKISLAQLYTNLGIIDGVESSYKQAIQLIREFYGDQHPSYSRILNSYANFLIKTKEYHRAEEEYKNVLAITNKTLGNQVLEYAKYLYNFSTTQYHLKHYKRAVDSLHEAKLIVHKKSKKSPLWYNIIYLEGLIKKEQNKFSEALEKFNQCVEYQEEYNSYSKLKYIKLLDQIIHIKNHSDPRIITNDLIKLIKSLNWQLKYSTEFLSEFECDQMLNNELIPIINTSFKNALILNDPEINPLIYNLVITLKGYLLNSEKTTIEYILNSTDSDNNLKLNELLVIRNQLYKLSQKEIIDSSEISKVVERKRILEKELAFASKEYKKNHDYKNIEHSNIASNLKQTEIAIEFIRVGNESKNDIQYAAAILSSDGKVRLTPICSEQNLLRLIEKYSLKNNSPNGIYSFNDSLSFYNTLWKPLNLNLKNIKQINFSPVGLLNRINIPALPINEFAQISDSVKMKHFSNTKNIVLLKSKKRNNNALIMGGVKNLMEDTTVINDAPVLKIQKRYSLTNQFIKNIKDQDFRYLKGSEIECRRISKVLKSNGFDVDLITGIEASEKRFKEIGNKTLSPKIIHLATHGFYIPSDQFELSLKHPMNNPMLRSGISLSNSNKVRAFDGVLTAYEVSHMNLSNTYLTVLSSCNSGLGDNIENEGTFGLQRAFKKAGVEYLIYTLWEIPDQTTMEFMTNFYTNWLEKKMSIHRSFFEAQKKLKEKYIDPKVWASFVLMN